jgi:hypothetical protein
MNHKARAVIAAGAVLAGAAGLTLVASAPAMASTSSCPSSDFCMWSNSGYGGTIYKNPNSSSFVGNSFNDQASSAYNHGTSGQAVHVFLDQNYSNSTQVIPKGQKDSDFQWEFRSHGGTWNDVISSFYWAW